MTTPTQTVLIGGASGLIGQELVRQLRNDGHAVLRLVRRPAAQPDEREWHPESGLVPADAIVDADAIVNLSGASISRMPWTHPYKRSILQSRVQATATLARAIAASPAPPAVFVSGSAVGYYGNRPGETLTEDASRGEGFLPRVVESWEGATAPADAATRVVHARTGLVLASGGALAPLRLLTTFGLGGPLGSGEQVWPWISLHDEVAALRHLIFSSELAGPVNLAAPVVATAGEIGRIVAKQLHRPFWLPAPAWAISTALADAGRELLLADQRVDSSRLRGDGFTFRDSSPEQAIAAAL